MAEKAQDKLEMGIISGTGQELAALVIVALAIAYLARRIYHTSLRSAGGGCGCTACPIARRRTPLVRIERLRASAAATPPRDRPPRRPDHA